jgi:hypothetical protein
MGDVNLSGPMFDGRAELAVSAFIDDAEREVAQAGHDMAQSQLRGVLRQPTGFYQSRVVVDRSAGDPRIHDSGVVYGPWLEGTGSRNRTTRFKGYRTFRIVRQRLQGRASQIAERVLPRYLGRMS